MFAVPTAGQVNEAAWDAFSSYIKTHGHIRDNSESSVRLLKYNCSTWDDAGQLSSCRLASPCRHVLYTLYTHVENNHSFKAGM